MTLCAVQRPGFWPVFLLHHINWLQMVIFMLHIRWKRTLKVNFWCLVQYRQNLQFSIKLKLFYVCYVFCLVQTIHSNCVHSQMPLMLYYSSYVIYLSDALIVQMFSLHGHLINVVAVVKQISQTRTKLLTRYAKKVSPSARSTNCYHSILYLSQKRSHF